MNEAVNHIIDGLYSGFVDGARKPLEQFRPKLVVNDYRQGEKVLSALESELRDCTEFYFSVAFITNSGVQSVLSLLDALAEKGVRGKILTSQYQNFTQPSALRRLLKYENISLRIVTKENFHAKGYIFRKADGSYSFIVGSSNLTQSALGENKEWNIRMSSCEDGSVMRELIREFQYSFAEADPVDEEWISRYEREYYYAEKIRFAAKKENSGGLPEPIRVNQILPNRMQTEALAHIEELREKGKDKALLISATGTGKTYLSAFDVRAFGPKKFLFIVHRENIARTAMNSFRKVLGYNIRAGLVTGNQKDYEADYLFGTIQTISRDYVLEKFAPDWFDYIVIDEVHKAGAATYQKVIDYFRPAFLLGMTATPERSDGFDIFRTFDYNIAYEIRLERALEEKMLSPFHYFGIQDLTVDGRTVDDFTDFNRLVCDERVDRILQAADHFGHDGNRVKGLIFCSRKNEAKQLSDALNQRGLRTVALCGENSEEQRERAIDCLEADSGIMLDYILTVDIFNEGVDIPSVNQIIMLRPTQSAIIFVQQLGRGLRKAENKEFLTVIDFIGNYSNNYMIPIALYGDRTYNKDRLRKVIAGGSRMIPGCSTVSFDEITRRKIFDSIDSANFNDVKLLKECYKNLKYKLGKIPSLRDFDDYGTLDVLRIFDAKTIGSYYMFLKKYEKDFTVRFDPVQEEFLEYVSRKFASGKRPHELELLKILMEQESGIMVKFEQVMREKYGIEITSLARDSLVNLLTNQFATGSNRNTFARSIFIQADGEDYRRSEAFSVALQDEDFFRMLKETVEFGLYRNRLNYSSTYQDTNFCLYEKYTYEDVCRLLDWDRGEVALNIGGYKYHEKTKTFPVFINYHKDEDISDTIAYEDEFISPSHLQAFSKSKRKASSPDIVTIYNAPQLGVDIELFVRRDKNDAISKEFYYLGRIHAAGEPEEMVMKNNGLDIVRIQYELDTPVRDDVYEYITM
ncbi:MAG: DUF3427 domain-containing protein [Emergencia sp.]